MTINRRDFVKAGTVTTTGLMLGLNLPMGPKTAQAAGTVYTPNAWVHISDDNIITLISARSEMGQGVYTSMPMLIAEELNVPLSSVKVAIAPPGAAYVNSLLGAQITGGSTSVRDGWEKLRVGGAQVRDMLREAAAKKWGVAMGQVTANNGMLTGPSGQSATYGAMAGDAAKLKAPEKVALKDPKDFTIVGKPAKRLDTPMKVNGTAEFGIDAKLPGMVYASVIQSPVIGGKATSFDASKAKAMPGVIDVVNIGDGVAVVANSYWQAKKARDVVSVQWDAGAGASLSTASMWASTREAANNGKLMHVNTVGNYENAIKGASKVLSADYTIPHLAHAPLEPMNFTASFSNGKIRLIGPTQFQQGVAGAVGAVLGVKPEDITVETTFLGGGFGRRIELDFVIQAALISKSIGRPVKMLWTREDDMTHDFYRPLALNRLRGGLDASGNLVAMAHQVTSQSVTQRAFGLPKDIADPFMLEAAVAPYVIPNTSHSLVIHDTGSRVGYWRCVSHYQNAFANEGFIDELAQAAGKDPVAFRMSMLDGKPRFSNVLKMASERAGWGKPLAAGRAHGVALMEGYDTYMAMVAEVSQGSDGEIRVHKITSATDLGQVVNPDIVDAQIMSSVIYGLSSALYNEITYDKGVVQQTNFNNYRIMRMNEAPVIDSVLVKSTEKPGGIGEPGTAVAVAAVANAVSKLLGKRVRSLPMTPEKLRQA
jgi:isoquinoline 1-oxidoreductase subunit beta